MRRGHPRAGRIADAAERLRLRLEDLREEFISDGSITDADRYQISEAILHLTRAAHRAREIRRPELPVCRRCAGYGKVSTITCETCGGLGTVAA